MFGIAVTFVSLIHPTCESSRSSVYSYFSSCIHFLVLHSSRLECESLIRDVVEETALCKTRNDNGRTKKMRRNKTLARSRLSWPPPWISFLSSWGSRACMTVPNNQLLVVQTLCPFSTVMNVFLL